MLSCPLTHKFMLLMFKSKFSLLCKVSPKTLKSQDFQMFEHLLFSKRNQGNGIIYFGT